MAATSGWLWHRRFLANCSSVSDDQFTYFIRPVIAASNEDMQNSSDGHYRTRSDATDSNCDALDPCRGASRYVHVNAVVIHTTKKIVNVR